MLPNSLTKKKAPPPPRPLNPATATQFGRSKHLPMNNNLIKCTLLASRVVAMSNQSNPYLRMFHKSLFVCG